MRYFKQLFRVSNFTKCHSVRDVTAIRRKESTSGIFPSGIGKMINRLWVEIGTNGAWAMVKPEMLTQIAPWLIGVSLIGLAFRWIGEEGWGQGAFDLYNSSIPHALRYRWHRVLLLLEDHQRSFEHEVRPWHSDWYILGKVQAVFEGFKAEDLPIPDLRGIERVGGSNLALGASHHYMASVVPLLTAGYKSKAKRAAASAIRDIRRWKRQFEVPAGCPF